jgi:hypothetical protein
MLGSTPYVGGKLPLSDAKPLLIIDQFLSQTVTVGEGVKAKELDYSRHMLDARRGVSLLPIQESKGGASDCPCHVLLEEIEIETPLSDVFSDGFWGMRIADFSGLVWTGRSYNPLNMSNEKRQRSHAGSERPAT